VPLRQRALFLRNGGHVAPTLHASPRPHRGWHARGPARPSARAGPAIAVRPHRGLPGTLYSLRWRQTTVVVLLVRAAGPSLDAGALRQYIANPCKEGGKPAES
jgi:hypothetical protein